MWKKFSGILGICCFFMLIIVLIPSCSVDQTETQLKEEPSINARRIGEPFEHNRFTFHKYCIDGNEYIVFEGYRKGGIVQVLELGLDSNLRPSYCE